MLGRIIQAVRDFNPQARRFFVVMVCLAFVVDGVYTVLLNLYLLRLGYGTEFIGLVNAVALLTFAFTSLPAGLLGSRVSNTWLMKCGAALCLVGGVLLPMVEWLPPGWREGWLVINYALMLGGFSLFFVNGATYLINVVDTAYKHSAFALKTASWLLAGFAGSLIGGILPGLIVGMQNLTLEDPAPYRLTLTIAAAMIALGVLLIQRIQPLPHPGNRKAQSLSGTSASEDSDRMDWTTPLIVLIGMMTLIRLFQVAGTATVLVYFNVYMDRQLAVSTAMIGGIIAIGKLTGVPTALLTPWLVRRWGNVNVVIWATLLSALFLLPLALVEHWTVAALGFIGSLAVMSIRYTAFIVYILDLVPRVQQSVMAGSGEMAAGLSFACMALGGGIILSLFAFRDLFLLGALCSFMGTLMFWQHTRRAKPKRKLAPV